MIDYRFDAVRALAFVRVSGGIDDAEVLAWFADFIKEMAKRLPAGGVVDARGLASYQVSSETLHQMLRMAQAQAALFAGARWAFVADQDVVFGMSRMFELLSGSAPWEIRVFRSLEEARRWVEGSA